VFFKSLHDTGPRECAARRARAWLSRRAIPIESLLSLVRRHLLDRLIQRCHVRDRPGHRVVIVGTRVYRGGTPVIGPDFASSKSATAAGSSPNMVRDTFSWKSPGSSKIVRSVMSWWIVP
jgi:hypothetical protein